jgi:hypothetical protein
MKYGVGDLVAFGYKIGTITRYYPQDNTYQIEWGGKRLEIYHQDKVGELRQNFQTLRNLLKLSGYSNGI